MAEYKKFDKFARDFFLYLMLKEEKLNKCDLTPLMLDAIKVFGFFSKGHVAYFRRAFIETQYQEMQTDEQLFKFTVPRCLNLIDDDKYYYSLMLVACYLVDFVKFLQTSRMCFRFQFIVYKCFLAVFKRKFEEKFEGIKPFQRFLSQVKYMMLGIEVGDYLKTLTENDQHYDSVLQLISKCNDVSDDLFNLNDYEQLLIIDDEDQDILMQFSDPGPLDPDPLGFQWPPCKLEVKRVVTRYWQMRPEQLSPLEERSDSAELSEADRDDDYRCSDLSVYTPLLRFVKEGDFGDKPAFNEAMKSRLCPCCGLRCYLLSRKFFAKQFRTALKKTVQKPLDKCASS